MNDEDREHFIFKDTTNITVISSKTGGEIVYAKLTPVSSVPTVSSGASFSSITFYEFTDTKANTLTTAHKPKIIDELGNYKRYAEPCEWNDNGEPTKAISFADGKKYVVYSIVDGQIEIKGKTYPIKLKDGYYIIRKLTVKECMRLQTVPEWYDFSAISNSQAYKCLGNGWTVEVIKHLLSYMKE
jgi:site-specific DNA-cytosine methylase